MRKGMFLGKQILLTNKHWERCLKRVDVRRAVAGGNTWFIHVKCPFCKSRGRPCQVTECPLSVYALQGSHEWGCARLFKLVMKKVGAKTFPALFDDYVSWDTCEPENKDARKILEFIHKGLLSMKTTNRRKWWEQ